MTRLAEKYRNEIVPSLQEELGRQNIHSLPRVEKVVLNMGIGKAIQDRKRLEEAIVHLGQISGQKPQITRAKKSIANFRLREGMEVGCRVTLRGPQMYEFLDRLITLALPRVRDFRGVSRTAFDGNGNYSMGLSEQMVFPEIDADNAKYTQGLNITIVTSARNNDEARTLLTKIGIPFRKPGGGR
ncbi:MAG: 50S ribosomal protein L5 [Rubinisphaera brasiliensis]|uniref:Large ribosomal subunit protein uL5 n=1 Tax=Rubinisphaera brasiliensis (strain ATCC 49424 / DSM 5305 / JCM 21570 / IAM 15109 / NBRC 103401 / IFAM 1448) TaxID=756272 RepID=F0SJ98_RUBBR|nr:50S ribosomal protein L5 [Rubinisphaera brasiliensis]ADY59673.1 LSU ribosomal protein L5P [Rubinisphaera brasiliensis DSM 5305]MBR9803435.1 50S ribosomal protein L5 [bacterium]